MKISEYPEVDTLEMTDSFIVETGAGTRQVKVPNMQIPNGLSDDPVVVHRNTFRGKNLGDEYTEEQKTMIRNGTFDDLFVGDYWEISNHKWRIADINYYKRATFTEPFISNSLIIVPDEILYQARMNSTNTNTNGYGNSEMYTSNLNQAKTLIQNVFGASIIEHKDYLQTSVNAAGNNTVVTLKDNTISLLNENMVFGHPQMQILNNFTSGVYPNLIENTVQLSLFRLNPFFISPNINDVNINDVKNYWLTDPNSNVNFCIVATNGSFNVLHASDNAGVRPFFFIKG